MSKKRLSILPAAFALAAILAWGATARAERLTNAEVTVSIPGKYALLVVNDSAPLTQADEEAVKKEAYAKRDALKVSQLQVAFVAEGKKAADELLALANIKEGFSEEWMWLLPQNEEQAKFFPRLLGYEGTAKELWQAFEDNEVVAEEDFKGKPVVIVEKCEGVAKDPFGKIYVKIPVDKTGIFGVNVYLKKDDPQLRQLKKGQTVGLRIFPQRYVAKSVLADGEILQIVK